MHSRLLFIGVAGFALGVLLSSLVEIPWAAVGYIALIGAVFIFLRVSKKASLYLSGAVLLLAGTLGMARTVIQPNALPEAFASRIGTPSTIEGKVVADPDVRETAQRLTVELRDGEAVTRVLVVASSYPEVSYGETVHAYGTLEYPKPFETDGGRTFRYDKFLAKDGIFAMVQHTQVEVIAPRSGVVDGVFGFFTDIKHAFTKALNEVLPEPESALAAGILVGGKQGLGERLIEAFTITGMLQIVVLSGYNVMIVAEWVRRMFGFLRKRAALTVAGFSIIIFVLIAGAGSSAVRAGIMACIALFARATGKTYDALRALFTALLLMLLVNPFYLAYDPGLELSAVATLGLILLSPAIELRLAFIRSAFLRDIIATTLAAQIFVLPLLLWLTGNLSLVSLAANVLAMPVIPAAMLLSFLAALAAFVVPIIAPVVGFPAHLLLSYVIGVADIGSRLPFAQMIVPAFPFWIVILCYAALAYVSASISKKLQLRGADTTAKKTYKGTTHVPSRRP